ncbi:unnamed protein product [Anisakis simplex]|uniref:Uncharacterized protein n=1 Tax=Anisakis simplex TaxID=6269 RepID=A0A3P6MZM3_ANISI|nr:unnamed protein product [Anisakis simplex]
MQMKQSEPSSVRYDQNSSFVSKQQVNCTQEQSVATIRDPLNSDITNPSSISPANTPKCSAPIVPIVHHKGVPKVPQKQQSLDNSVTNRYVQEKNELEEKLAKQRQRKTSTPIVSEDVRQRNAISEDRMPPNSPPANSAILNGGRRSAFTKVGSAPPIAKIPNEDHVFIPICPSSTTKVPPPPPKKPSVSTMVSLSES